MKIRFRKPVSQILKLGFIGDTVPGFPAYKPIRKSRSVQEILHSCDWVTANLESPLTNASARKVWGSSLLSEPKSIEELKKLNVRIANLANNHIIDQGLPGLEETLTILSRNGIKHLGAGKDITDASKPIIFRGEPRPIAFLGYSFKTLCYPSLADDNTPGANPLIITNARKRIRYLKNQGYIVCVSYHGGDEFFRIPCPKYRTVLRQLAQSGAHLVIGHHSHIFQGIEMYNGSLIAYSLGNFYMNTRFQRKHRGTDIGLLLAVELDENGVCAYSADFVHNHRPQNRLTLLQEPQQKELTKLLENISNALVDDRTYYNQWRRDCCRLVFGMNAKGFDPLYLKTARNSYGFRILLKSVLTSIKRPQRRGHMNPDLPNTPNSSIVDLITAAVTGLIADPTGISSLHKCYQAYEVEPLP